MGIFNKAKRRLSRQKGRYALVDGIQFHLPVNSEKSPALMSMYSIDYEKAKTLMPGNELHPVRLWKRAVLVITVIDYRVTDIGKYIEYSIAILCTKGKKPAPRLLPAMFMKTFKTGQYVIDLPVSTDISVKGGKGIWGMPKHKQSLNFLIKDKTVSAQYDLDGQLAMYVEIPKPKKIWVPLNIAAANYCTFRGMLVKSYVNFKTKLGFNIRDKDDAHLVIGNHPRVRKLKELDISPKPMMTAYLPEFEGLLDDHFESWFISSDKPIEETPEGLESIYFLTQSEEWPAEPIPYSPEVTQDEKPPVGITFSETMAGGFSLGADTPTAGEEEGSIKGHVLAMHATIQIDDIERFIKDPEHKGKISGTIDFAPLGMGMIARNGRFNLFCPTDSPEMKHMVYEMGFLHDGEEYYLAGHKQVQNDSGLDLWKDTTTLLTTLYKGKDSSGEILGSGILSLGVKDLLAMVATFRALNSESASETSSALYKFGEFFMGSLWDSYAPGFLNKR